MTKKRSLSDFEVSLIRAMLARNYPNTRIQAYFTRPDRVVNSARVTNIKNDHYGKGISAATDSELDAFLKDFARQYPSADAPVVSYWKQLILAQLARQKAGHWEFEGDESTQVELKQSFKQNRFGAALRAIAALANNKGGCVVFGIKDDGEVVGLSDTTFFDIDIAWFSGAISSAMTPCPSFSRERLDIGGFVLGALVIERIASPPVITTKNDDPLRESVIYFRYPGQSKAIHYGELVSLLESRDRGMRKGISTAIDKALEIGPGNLALLNLATGEAVGGGGSFLLDESLLGKVQFIKEGEFHEKSGAPTIKLVGEARPIDPRVAVRKSNVGELDIIGDFVNRAIVSAPLEYVRALLEIQRMWVPVRYYLRLAGLKDQAALDAIQNMNTRHAAKKKRLMDRVRRSKNCYCAPGPTVSGFRAALLAGKTLDFSSDEGNPLYALRAIRSIKQGETTETVLFANLQAAWQRLQSESLEGVKWYDELCYAASHVDVLCFA
jgi:hypothetical protein